eukprot:CAMPEP_0115459402 /NCGR_PEP_ID=MMETSP0271-20121206/46235_1 /TAXON_ID=71861 /ORGANISM="Scrippsiella trochoidea, Strain CCMP3099" /LENGTH=84 /DNA_ID=CAMNT_0002886047 /DNA_START=166 /DNA_END=420 /DNA_ORIENTATION=+
MPTMLAFTASTRVKTSIAMWASKQLELEGLGTCRRGGHVGSDAVRRVLHRSVQGPIGVQTVQVCAEEHGETPRSVHTDPGDCFL